MGSTLSPGKGNRGLGTDVISTFYSLSTNLIDKFIFFFLKCLRLKIFNLVELRDRLEKVDNKLLVFFYMNAKRSNSSGENQIRHVNLL